VVDNIGNSRSLIDHVRVCSADHQDVENPFGEGCEWINTHPIQYRGHVMDVVRNTSPRFHCYWCEWHIIGHSLNRIRIVLEAKSGHSTQEGVAMEFQALKSWPCPEA